MVLIHTVANRHIFEDIGDKRLGFTLIFQFEYKIHIQATM